jgi:hypothetical protein
MKTTINIEVEVEYDYFPGIRPFLSGRPEDCYEGNDEFAEISSVKFGDIEIVDLLDRETITALGLECISDVHENIAERGMP